MLPDRVSVGSPGGAGGNEIEAVAGVLRDCTMLGPSDGRYVAELAIAALDAVRRSPQGDPTVPWQQWNDEVNTRINAQIELADARAEIKRMRSPQGEDHEAVVSHWECECGQRVEWKLGAWFCPTHRDKAVVHPVAASSSVSGTELGIGSWMCPRCGETAVTPDRHECPVSGTEPDTAKLVEALCAADALADAVLSWESHVTLEGLTGAYRSARAGFSVDAGKARRCCGIIYGHGALTGPQPCPGCPDMEAGPDGR